MGKKKFGFVVSKLTLYLDSKLGEKRKKGKWMERKGNEGERKKGIRLHFICIERKRRGKKEILFSFQIFPLIEKFGC